VKREGFKRQNATTMETIQIEFDSQDRRNVLLTAAFEGDFELLEETLAEIYAEEERKAEEQENENPTFVRYQENTLPVNK
jgi:hypothetical protein